MFGDALVLCGLGVEATPFLGMFVKIRQRKVSSMREVWSVCCGVRRAAGGVCHRPVFDKIREMLRICFSSLVCAMVVWTLGGCASVCPDCPSVTFQVSQKLDACPNGTSEVAQTDSFAMVLQFRLTKYNTTDEPSAQIGHAWIYDKAKLPQNAGASRSLNNFFCTQGERAAQTCPCVEANSGKTNERKCQTNDTFRVVNGMNLLVAIQPTDLEGNGFRFQVTTATTPKEPDLFVLKESLFPDLLAEGEQQDVTFSPAKWQDLRFSVKGYWRQDINSQTPTKPKRVGVVKARTEVSFSPTASVIELVKDDNAACPNNL